MSQIVPFLDPNGKMGIKTPYNALFVDDLKKAIPSASWNPNQQIWFFDPLSKDQAERLLEKYYPKEEDKQLVRITWSLSRQTPTIDGVHLITAWGKSWRWKRDCPFEIKVIEADLATNGCSLFGTCIIETRLRDGAVLSPGPANFEIIEQGQNFSPLARFTDEELARELISRGYEILKRQ